MYEEGREENRAPEDPEVGGGADFWHLEDQGCREGNWWGTARIEDRSLREKWQVLLFEHLLYSRCCWEAPIK